MVEVKIENARYTYIHDLHKDSFPQALDTYHIVLRRNAASRFLIYFSALLLNAYAISLFLLKGNTIFVVIWEPSYWCSPCQITYLEACCESGRINRCFVPVGKILKPVLNECLTPVTCYWCLSLIIRGEEELMVVFKGFHLPIKMLVPIWKTLCAAIDSKGSFEVLEDDWH